MPSEEEYLDQLLKGIMEPAETEPEPVTEPSLDEEPIIEEPIIEEAVIEEAVIEEPITIEEIDEAPVMQEPAFDVPVIEEPAFDIPVIEELAEISDMPEFMEMPELDESLEDDDILKKMVSENATIEDVLQDDFLAELAELEELEEPSTEESDGMSVEDIEQILAENQSQAEAFVEREGNALTDNEDADLMSLLEEAPEDELQDIYDMLRKSDNNEAVDEDMLALLGTISGNDEAAMLQAELDAMEETGEAVSGLTEREKKAAEKKRLKAEKAEARRAAKEAKKAEKEAQRAAKKAAKETAKENKEAVAGSAEAKESDVFEGIDELSAADMLDLQDLLAFGAMDSSSQDGITELQQEVNRQSEPKIAEVPEENVAVSDDVMDEAMSADMQEIDELLSLAGISDISEDVASVADLADESSEVEYLNESEVQEKIPEKEKKGFFARILDFLTETDEDEEQGTEDIPLSDENRNILEEMDKEEKAGGKKKGKKDKNI